MAGGGYRGILAAVPTAQNLHSASRGGVHRKIKSQGELTLGLMSGENQKRTRPPVGASLLAKNAQTPHTSRQPASSLTTIASKLAPTILIV
jgi:hypothetical protein